MLIKVLKISKEERSAAAAIALSDDGKYLYLSVRGQNTIEVIDVEKWQIIQSFYSGGDHPRDLKISLDQKYILVANRFSDKLVCFKRDLSSGKIITKLAEVEIKQAVTIAFKGEENE